MLKLDLSPSKDAIMSYWDLVVNQLRERPTTKTSSPTKPEATLKQTQAQTQKQGKGGKDDKKQQGKSSQTQGAGGKKDDKNQRPECAWFTNGTGCRYGQNCNKYHKKAEPNQCFVCEPRRTRSRTAPHHERTRRHQHGRHSPHNHRLLPE